MSSTTIYIDTRESKLRELLEKNEETFITKPLELGDILIEHPNRQILIERKTIADFHASITDGRYKNQKLRLLEWRNKEDGRKNIIYLSGLFYNFKKNNKFDKKIINLEKKSLLNFVSNIKNFNMKINDIRIRYHPSEKYFFYRENLKKNKITVSKNIQLIDDLNWADLIIGANSMAIYLCKMLNLSVYSSLPYNFSGSIIPLKKMRNISLLFKNSNGN